LIILLEQQSYIISVLLIAGLKSRPERENLTNISLKTQLNLQEMRSLMHGRLQPKYVYKVHPSTPELKLALVIIIVKCPLCSQRTYDYIDCWTYK
jgi:hypothetical protein